MYVTLAINVDPQLLESNFDIKNLVGKYMCYLQNVHYKYNVK